MKRPRIPAFAPLAALFAAFCLAHAASFAAEPARLPRLLDLGAGKCIPCKQMVPVLAALTTEYAGQLEVVFIDVWQNPEAGKTHAIRMIPTQIFYDATGKEFARHEGYWSQQAILEQFQKAGIALKPASPAPAAPAAAQP
jgi:thioredoxin 1